MTQALALQAAAVFVAIFVLDFVWARYTYAMTQERPWAAGFYGAAIFLLSGFSVVQYTTNHWLLIPAAIGGFAGTFAAVKWKRIASDRAEAARAELAQP